MAVMELVFYYPVLSIVPGASILTPILVAVSGFSIYTPVLAVVPGAGASILYSSTP